MDRRQFVGSFAALAAFLVAFPVGALWVSPAEAGGGTGWGYGGATGPSRWGGLNAAYATCRTGVEQSPVDLSQAQSGETEALTVNYRPVPLQIANNGHTIKCPTAPGNRLTIDGKTYDLLQFHFHHASEHAIDGQFYPLEMHLVHQNPDDQSLAVLGILFEVGRSNMRLAPMFANMPMQMSPILEVPGVSIDLPGLLPQDRTYYRYQGSLTTPPCTEGVTWTVLKQPLSVSRDQIAAFARLFPLNNRPLQPVNERVLMFSN